MFESEESAKHDQGELRLIAALSFPCVVGRGHVTKHFDLLRCHFVNQSLQQILPLCDALCLQLEAGPHVNLQRQNSLHQGYFGDECCTRDFEPILRHIQKTDNEIFQVLVLWRNGKLSRKRNEGENTTNVRHEPIPVRLRRNDSRNVSTVKRRKRFDALRQRVHHTQGTPCRPVCNELRYLARKRLLYLF